MTWIIPTQSTPQLFPVFLNRLDRDVIRYHSFIIQHQMRRTASPMSNAVALISFQVIFTSSDILVNRLLEHMYRPYIIWSICCHRNNTAATEEKWQVTEVRMLPVNALQHFSGSRKHHELCLQLVFWSEMFADWPTDRSELIGTLFPLQYDLLCCILVQ